MGNDSGVVHPAYAKGALMQAWLAVWAYVKVLVVYVVVDVLYLVIPPVAAYNKSVIEGVQGSDVELRVAPAVLVYVVGAAALTWIITNAPQGRRVVSSAFMGFCIYGIYDLTNYATFTHYPLRMVVQDMLWGATSFGLSAFLYTRLLASIMVPCPSSSSSGKPDLRQLERPPFSPSS